MQEQEMNNDSFDQAVKALSGIERRSLDLKRGRMRNSYGGRPGRKQK